MDTEVKLVLGQLVEGFTPERIYLFGSFSREEQHADSDIDICVVMPAENKRRLLTELYLAVECGRPVDILLYTPEEWEESLCDAHSFAHKIHNEGVLLYGGQ
jgi:Predicted nucleotidyltransferases